MSPRVSIASLHATELVPMSPTEGGWVPVEGDANTQAQTFYDKNGIWSGVAVLEPCSFTYTAPQSGAIQILEGEATLHYDGTSRDLAAGDIIYLATGAETMWVVKKRMKEFFIAATGSQAVD